MTRNEFVNILFDEGCGHGIELKEIRQLEQNMIEIIPQDVYNDIIHDLGEDATDEGIIESALSISYDAFFDNLKDCTDLLKLQDLLTEHYKMDLLDRQIYYLFSLRG